MRSFSQSLGGANCVFYYLAFYEYLLPAPEIKEINDGVSTGTRWIKGEAGILKSYSRLMEHLLAR